jgi:D-3-phosphoglycerate dehydrogenase
VRLVDLRALCESSDIISLHLPLSPNTEGIIGKTQLAAMKPTAILVNTSRGGLIDQPELATALREGRLRGAALDVLRVEPPDVNDPLLSLDNVILTPHAGGYSDAVVWDIPRLALESVLAHVAPQSKQEPNGG